MKATHNPCALQVQGEPSCTDPSGKDADWPISHEDPPWFPVKYENWHAPLTCLLQDPLLSYASRKSRETPTLQLVAVSCANHLKGPWNGDGLLDKSLALG